MSINPDVKSVVDGVLRKIYENGSPSISQDLVNNYNVRYFVQGEFTTAMLQNKEDPTKVFLGVSKRNPEDHKNPLRGRALALSRAVVMAAYAPSGSL